MNRESSSFRSWLVGAALLLLAALVLNLGLLAYAMYALLGALLVSRFLTRLWAESLSATRECNRLTANVGDKVAVVIQIENSSLAPIPWVLLEDVLPKHALVFEPPSLRVSGRRLHLLMLGGRAKKTLTYQLECNRRGYFQVGPLVMETGDVFGLHRRYRVVTKPHYLLVYPRIVPLAGYEIASKRPIGEIRMTYRLFEDPTRVAGVRRYEAGDPLNRVHWRATARTGLLHSKVYEPSSIAGATILLDFHEKSLEARNEPYRSELAITAAASLANAVYELGQQIGLVTNGRDAVDRIRHEGFISPTVAGAEEVRSRDAARQSASMLDRSYRLRPVVVPTRHGVEQLTRVLETLARLELTDGLELPQLTLEAGSRIPRDATVVAIVTATTPEQIIALQNLRRRGFAVTVLINVFDEWDFATAAGALLAVGIEALHLKDEEKISSICQGFLLK